MEAFEDTEDLFRKSVVESDAIVGDRERPSRSVELRRDMDPRRNILGVVFQRVANQILEQLEQMRRLRFESSG